MRIPAFFHGPASTVMARARKAAATVAKGTFSGDLGPLIDTQEYDGLLMLEMRLLEEVGSTKTGESFRDRTVGLFGFPAYSRLSADACLGIDAEDLRSVGYELFEP